jgi:uncharacterized integral membrane protein
MRIKTIITLLVIILLVVLLLQNTGRDHLDFLWATFYMSKLILLTLVAGIGFVLGWLVGRPKRVRRLSGDFTDPDTLSDEDREYIE